MQPVGYYLPWLEMNPSNLLVSQNFQAWEDMAMLNVVVDHVGMVALYVENIST